MLETSVNQFRQHLKSEVDRCVETHEVLKVNRRNGENFVVVSESDWRSIEETLYLSRIPGMVESIKKASEEPLDQSTSLEDLNW